MMGGGGDSEGSPPTSSTPQPDETGGGRYAPKPRAKRVSRFDKPGATGGPNANKGGKGSKDGNKGGGRSDAGATGLLERPDSTKGNESTTPPPSSTPGALPQQPPAPKLADAADIERLRKLMGK